MQISRQLFDRLKVTPRNNRFLHYSRNNSIYVGRVFFLLIIMGCIVGCKKNQENTTPVVTLIGSATIDIPLQGTFTDPGATAKDEEDGDVTVTPWGAVDVNHAGVYEIRYKAIDKNGNVGTVLRTVRVYNEAEDLEGEYAVTVTSGGSGVYTQHITASTTVNNKIHFSLFSNYMYNTYRYAKVVGDSIIIEPQLAIQVGVPAKDRTFSGSGIVSLEDSSPEDIKLIYTISVPGGGVPDTVRTEEFVK